MSRPLPTSDCQPPNPLAPEQARTMGIHGMVLVEYVVHSDGHVGEVSLKNPTAPPILFDAVKTWLLSLPLVRPRWQGGKADRGQDRSAFQFQASEIKSVSRFRRK